jgi:diadenosine tetraphosphate (Ap4A) HIT family hydrolase
VGVNVGRAAGQTVMHAHVHLIPRYGGDVSDPRGGVRFVLSEKANYWDQSSLPLRELRNPE